MLRMIVSTDVAVGTWTNRLTFEPDPDYSPDAGTGLFSPIAYALQRGILLRRENSYWAHVAAATRGFESYALQRGTLLRRENPTCTGIRRPSNQRRVVLRRRNTVVGRKCALASALLV